MVDMKKYLYWLVLSLITYASVELVAFGGLLFLSKVRNTNYEPVDVISAHHRKILKRLLTGKTNYTVFSPELGWTIKKDGYTPLYQANSDGIRSSKKYPMTPGKNTLRICSFGDSFTHCDDVENDATWQVALENADPVLEAINFGVGGFGLDQAYLRYLNDGVHYQPHIVFIGYMSENIFRTVNTFRPFYKPESKLPLTKPRFTIKNGNISLLPNPISTLDDYNELLSRPKDVLAKVGANDYYYSRRYKSGSLDFSPCARLAKLFAHTIRNELEHDIISSDGAYNVASDAFKIITGIFDVFYEAATTNQSTPVIVIFPTKLDVNVYSMTKNTRYGPLLSHLEDKGYRYIDLMNAFDKFGQDYGEQDLFIGHYSPFANKLVAKHIYTYLDKNGLKKQESQ